MIEELSPSVMKELLKKHDFKFKKSLGQNFLTDKNILDKIVTSAEVTKEDNILEIGPGAGVLTRCLASAAKSVVAVELDKALLPILKESLDEFSNVEVVQGDILKMNLPELLAGKRWKVVANLPYYITTPVVMHLLENELPLDSITVMVQKEVAERMAAKPGGKEYGNLSVAVQYFTEAKIKMTVPKTVFIPQPEVDSAVINLKLKEEPPVKVDSAKDFFRVVKAAFAQRRKTLNNCLKNGLALDKEAVESIFTQSKIDGKRRGETLSLDEFATLANCYTNRDK